MLRRSMTLPLRIVLVVVAAHALFLAAMAFQHGPVGAIRMMRDGDPDIGDFAHPPFRTLSASEHPYRFPRSELPYSPPPGVVERFGATDYFDLLRNNDTVAFIVVEQGTVVLEEYFQGHESDSLSQVFSVSKAITSILVGLAIDDGYLESVDQSIVSVVPELKRRGYQGVKLEDLLTMQSGSAYVEDSNPFGIHASFNFSNDLEHRILAVPMEGQPGRVWRYKSGDNALLGLVLSRALGAETVTQFADRRLWATLGMKHPGIWATDREHGGLERTWCCLALSAIDLAKIGKLYLDRGRWNGRQLIPERWVQSSTRPAIPVDRWPAPAREMGFLNYGYQWYVVDPREGDFSAFGKDGQFLYVNPQTETIVVRLGWSLGTLATSQWVELLQGLASRPSPKSQ